MNNLKKNSYIFLFKGTKSYLGLISRGKMQKKASYFIILPFIAASGTFLANDYFNAHALHGFFSVDLFFFCLIWCLPQKSHTIKIILSVLSILYGIFFNPIISIFLMLSIATSYISREKFFPALPIFLIFSLFFFIIDCSNLFSSAFTMSLKDFWTAASFFWWGGILFFLVPIIYLLIIFHFSRKFLFGFNPLIIKPLYAIFGIIVVLTCNHFIFQIQHRQSIVEFSLSNYFRNFDKKIFIEETPSGKPFSPDILSKETKDIFNIYKVPNDSSYIPQKTVSILIESFGVAKDTAIAKWMILHPFNEAKISFIGLLPRHAMFTQGAELEDFGFVSKQDSSTIPMIQALNKKNIESWYLHGYVGTFYKREKIYKQFGFKHLYFDQHFKSHKLSLCNYGFNGVCDSSIIHFIDSLLTEPSQKYIYWTTLDSHPPYYDNPNLPSYSTFCKNTFITPKECTYFSLIENTLKNIAQLANKHPDYKFIIKGDHRPIGTITPENYYFAWVPIIILN